MDLILLVLVLALIGLLVWLITRQPGGIPMPPGWATAIQLFAFIVVVLYLLNRFVNLPNVLPR